MKKSNPFCSSATPSLFCSALLAAFLSFSPVVSSAEITQAQMTAAVIAALRAYAEESTGDEHVLASIPLMDALGYEYLASLLVTDSTGDIVASTSGIGFAVDSIHDYWWPYIQKIGLGTTNVSQQLGFFSSNNLARVLALMSRSVGNVETNLAQMRFIPSNFDSLSSLRVYDADVVSSINSLGYDVHTLLNGIYSSVDGQNTGIERLLDDVIQYLIDIREAQDEQMTYWSEDPDEAISDAEEEADDGIADEYAESEEFFEDIELPTVSTDYEPTVSDPTISDDDLGLGSVDQPVDHNALLVLVPSSNTRSGASGSWLPEVEVDFGRQANLVSGLSRFGDWVGWLAGVLFAFKLSVKGIKMWRVVRTASVSAQVGENPIIHLAYDPF